MRYIFISSLFITTLLSASINDSLLKIHATIVPKISLMDFDFEKKLVDNQISISIYYEKEEYKSALFLEELIKSKYPDGIKEYKIKITLVEYGTKKCKASNIIFLMPTEDEKIIKIVEEAKKHQTLTFSYLKDDLKNGVMLSLNIGANVKPIINLDAIKDSKITLRPILLKISQRFADEN